MRLAALLLALAALPAAAQEDADDHVAEAGGLRVVHAWTPATDGDEALVYMEVENGSDATATLTGGAAEAAGTVELVGFALVDGEESWTPLPGVPVAPGDHLDLEPGVLALRVLGLDGALAQGDEIEMKVTFEAEGAQVPLAVHVAVEAEDATQHGHAGHAH